MCSYTETFVTRNAPHPSAEELATVAELRLALRRFMSATDDVTSAHGLSPRQYDLLALLHRPAGDSGPTATRIASELALSRSATTELLTRAEHAGLIARSQDAGNARIKHVSPTPEGTRRFFAAVAELRVERARLFELLRVAAGLAATLSTTAL
jgi:DNA-binding MarR family transcriptional regulator